MGRPAGSSNKPKIDIPPLGEQISFLPERVHLVVPYGVALRVQLDLFEAGDSRTLEQYCQSVLNDQFTQKS